MGKMRCEIVNLRFFSLQMQPVAQKGQDEADDGPNEVEGGFDKVEKGEVEAEEGADGLWKRRRRNIDKYITGRSCLTPGDNDDVLMRLCTPTQSDGVGICSGMNEDPGFLDTSAAVAFGS